MCHNKEVWKWVPKWKGYYKVSNHGRIRRMVNINYHHYGGCPGGRRPRVRYFPKGLVNPRTIGRPTTTLHGPNKKRSYCIHILVLEAFVKLRPTGMYGCHRDDNRYNNHLDNLYWGTPWQNKQDAKRNGRTNKGKNYNVGENHPRAKLTPKQVKQIRIKYDKNDCSIRSLARKFGISHSTVLDIVKGRSWTLPK